MGKQFNQLEQRHVELIQRQKMFFVATAACEGKVNLSPKGMDSFRVVDDSRVIWLNLTGSGNETAAHVLDNPRMTIMFCAFEGSPVILRLYGKAKAIHPRDADWDKLIGEFPETPGSRQIFDMRIDMVQTSCGFSVPLYEYQTDRDVLTKWSESKGEAGIAEYWKQKNQLSLDGQPTRILENSSNGSDSDNL